MLWMKENVEASVRIVFIGVGFGCTSTKTDRSDK